MQILKQSMNITHLLMRCLFLLYSRWLLIGTHAFVRCKYIVDITGIGYVNGRSSIDKYSNHVFLLIHVMRSHHTCLYAGKAVSVDADIEATNKYHPLTGMLSRSFLFMVVADHIIRFYPAQEHGENNR